MPYASRKHVKRLDPRGPLVFDARALGPGSVRTEERAVPAPADLRVELVSIPGLPRYGKAILGQDPRYPFPEQHGVIRQHHADHRGRSR